MNEEYYKKLQDPRWQRTRLRIMERADFACEYCGNDELQLHVHHKVYFKGRDPWEYDDAQLMCLCSECHGFFHDEEFLFNPLKELLSYLEHDGPFSVYEFYHILLGLLQSYDPERYKNFNLMHDSKPVKRQYETGKKLKEIIFEQLKQKDMPL